MKKILALALLLSSFAVPSFAQKQTEMTLEKDQTATGKKVFTAGVTLGPIPFSSLSSVPKQVEGTMIVISDGVPGTNCAGGGNGALGVYLNGHWNCSALASSLNNPVFTGSVTMPITGGGVQCLHVDNNGVLSGTGVDCGAGGGGGGGTVSQIGTPTANQAAVFTDTTHIKGQDKQAIDVRDADITCDGTTDDGPALNTLFGSISGRQVNFPDTCKIKTTVQLVIQGQMGWKLHGMGDRGATNGVSGPIIYGCNAAASGSVLYINRSGYGTVEGLSITPKGPSGCSTSTFTQSIQVDSTGNPGVTTHDLIFDHLGLSTGGGTITNYAGLAITDGGKQNGEMIRISNSWIHCQNSSGSIGIANLNGTSDNDLAEYNHISSCKYGIQSAGNMRMVGNLLSSDGANSVFGAFGASIYIPLCSSGQVNIFYNEADSGGPFIDNDHTGVIGCARGFNVIGNAIGVSDIASGEYIIDVGGGGGPWNLQGNNFLVTQNTSQYIIGSQAQPALKGPLGHLYEIGNNLQSPTLSNTLGWEDITRPFQEGESRSQDTVGTTVPKGPQWGTDLSTTNHLYLPPLIGNNVPNQSPYVGLRSWTGSTRDDWFLQSIALGSQSAFTFNHNAGPATTNWFNWDGQINGLTVGQLSTPAAPSSVAPAGTTGATTYTYAWVAYGQSGNTAGSGTTSTTTGNASLSTSNFNRVWSIPTSLGWNKYCAWRTAGGATQGKIGCVNAVATSANGANQDLYFIDDTGLVADGASLPVTNTTGQIVASGGTLNIASNLTANNVTTGNLVINGSCTGCGGGGGSGTVTSVATTAPITGGPFSTTGTIACPTCLVASSPAVGILHVAGSTQTATSSAVVDADLSGSVAVAHGGTGATTAANALIGLLPAGTRVGDILYCKTYASSACTLWDLVPGNGTGSTGWLQETSAGAPSFTIPPGSGTVAVVGAGNLTSTALVTGGGTQLTQTPSATTTLDSSGNISVAAGGSVGSADTGTPKFTFATNLITANKQVTGTIFNASTGFAIPAATTAGHYLRNNATNFVDSAIQAGDLPSLSGTYLALTGGGTMNGNILFTDNLYDLGAVSATRPRSGYFATSLNAPTINAGTGYQIGGNAPLGHFLCGTGTYYADCGRLVDDGSTLSYSGEIQATSFSITTPFQIFSSVPGSSFTAVTGQSGFGVSNDGDWYLNNGLTNSTPSKVLTAATNLFSGIGSGTNTSAAMVVGTGSTLAPTSGTVGRITANAMVFASTTLTNNTLPTDGQCLGRSGTTIIGFACSGGSAGTFQTNAVNLTSSSTINFQNSAATNGLTLTFANPSAGNVQLGLTGTLTNAGLTNSSTTVNGANCALGSACNVETAASGQLAVSGGSGSALTGAASLTYSGSTLATTAGGVVDLSAATGSSAFIVPTNVSNTAGAAGVIDYDATAANYHINNGNDSIVVSVPASASITNNNLIAWAKVGSNVTVAGAGIAKTDVVTAGSAAGAANQVAYSTGASKALSFAVLDATATHVLHATNPPAFGAIVAGDLPGTLSASTAITNAVLTTPNLGTPTTLHLNNADLLPLAGIATSSGVASASTYLRGDGTWSAATGTNGMSGMTAAQVPIAASANTVTSSEVLAGAGAGITTGPTTSTTGDVVSFTGTGGQIADSAVLAANLVTAASNYTSGQFVKAAGNNKTTSSAAIAAADLPAALDNSTSINGTSVALSKTLVYTDSTTLNKVTLTAPTSGSTLTIADGKTLTATNTMNVSKQAGIAGAIPWYDTTTSQSATALLAANGVMIGGGASAAPSTITASTTTTQALFATAGAPAFRGVALGDVPSAAVPVVATVVDTSSPVTVSATASSEYHFNEHATAATAMTYNLPTAAAGKQFCISNAYNGTAANTGVITIAGSAAGQFIIFTDGTLSATGGNVTSGGAAADAACVVGVDATHWMLYVNRGTWTKH